MGGFGSTLGDARGAERLRQMQKSAFPQGPQGGGGGGEGKRNFELPHPRDLVLVEMALDKLEGRVKEKVTREEAEAVARVCWEKAEKTAEYFCRVVGGGQKDYPSTALRRLLQRVYRYVGKYAGFLPAEDACDPQAAFYLLGPEIFHMARTTSKDGAKKFFIECGKLVRNLADWQEPRRPTGRGLTVFLERVICFAERYAVAKSSGEK